MLERFGSEDYAEKADFYMDYEPGEILGDGLSSVVRRCVHKETGNEYAVKIIDKFSKDGQSIKGVDIITQVHTEVKALTKLKMHPSIITLYDFYESSAFLFLVFELAVGGELFDYLTKEVTLPEKISRRIMWQLLQAIKYVHNQDLVHRDIKLENILLDENRNLLISDFGFAINISDGEMLHEVLGTPSYFAPETLRCVVYDDATGYGKHVDMWACGVILYTLLVGQGPFWHRRDTIMYRKIMEGKYSLSTREWEDISEGPKDLIRKLLVVDPQLRYTAGEALSHPWFEGMSPCGRCTIMSDTLPQKKMQPKLSFKTLVYTIVTLKRLYFNYHDQCASMTYKAVLSEPYAFRNVRKVVDGCAFTMYGHWVKRTLSHNQDREALFENSTKNELVNSYNQDGQPMNLPSMYCDSLTASSFMPKNASLYKLNNLGGGHVSLLEL